MTKYYDCVFKKNKIDNCLKSWGFKPTKREVIAHHFDDHRTNLQFLPEDEILQLVMEVDE